MKKKLIIIGVVILLAAVALGLMLRQEIYTSLRVSGIIPYSQEQYEAMQDFFVSNKIFHEKMREKLATKDSSAASAFDKLMVTPYESRDEITELTNRDIAAIVYSSEISARVMRQFKEIDEMLQKAKARRQAELPKQNPDSTSNQGNGN